MTYVDDAVIGACDPAGAETLAEAIKMRFGNAPGGPLSFKFIKTVNAEQGFSFLGYWIRLISIAEERRMLVRPSHEAMAKLKSGVFRRLKELGPGLDWDTAAERARRYRVSWTRSFKLWEPNEVELSDISGIVDTYVDDYFNGYVGTLTPKLNSFGHAGQ